MALESADVFVVQKMTGDKPVCKLSVQQLSDYLGAQPGVTYKGAGNMTDVNDTPSSPNIGDLWLNDAPNAGTWAWGAGYTGTVETTARAIWDGSAWDVMPGQSGDIGVESIGGADPIHITGDAATPVVNIYDASTTQVGAVQLATVQDVTTGAAGVVVTADQLKTTNDAISAAGGGTVTNVTGVDPIEVVNNTSTPAVSIKDAGFTQKGATTLSDDTVFNAAADDTAATPKYVDSFYLISNFSSLDDA